MSPSNEKLRKKKQTNHSLSGCYGKSIGVCVYAMKVREFRNISKLPDGGVFHDIIFSDITLYFKQQINYGRPLSVSGRPCYILPMFLFIYFLWPPYSPAMVNGGSRKFYTW